MAAGKGLLALLADLETREVVCVFKGSGGLVIGTPVAGDREVCIVRTRSGRTTNVLLGQVFELFELEGSGLEAMYPDFAAVGGVE